MIGSNVTPFPGAPAPPMPGGPPPGMPMMPGGFGMMPPQQPQMMLNPEFQQWLKMKEAYDQEAQQRQEKFAAACALLKDDVCKSYQIDIEADSTVAADEEAEKAARTEFLLAIVPFMQVMVPQMMAAPALAPLAAEMIKFAFHAFPASRQLEDALESALEKMQQMPPQAPQQEHKGKSLAETHMETQLGHAQIKSDMAQTQMKVQADAASDAMKMMAAQAKLRADQEKAQTDAELQRAELALRSREIEGRQALDQAKLVQMSQQGADGVD